MKTGPTVIDEIPKTDFNENDEIPKTYFTVREEDSVYSIPKTGLTVIDEIKRLSENIVSVDLFLEFVFFKELIFPGAIPSTYVYIRINFKLNYDLYSNILLFYRLK